MGINDFIKKHNEQVTAAAAQPSDKPAGESSRIEQPERKPGALGERIKAGLKAQEQKAIKESIERQERKVLEHELKAGKTFRRTKKQLKKAQRHQRRADRMKDRFPADTAAETVAPQTSEGRRDERSEKREKRERLRRWYQLAPDEEKQAIEVDFLRELTLDDGLEVDPDQVKRWLQGEDVQLGPGPGPPGWYQDSDRPWVSRYWDGDDWTKFRAGARPQ